MDVKSDKDLIKILGTRLQEYIQFVCNKCTKIYEYEIDCLSCSVYKDKKIVEEFLKNIEGDSV